MAVSASGWGVAEVCDWVEVIGLGQYRQRFLHQCVAGRLLLHLTDVQLKVCPVQLRTVSWKYTGVDPHCTLDKCTLYACRVLISCKKWACLSTRGETNTPRPSFSDALSGSRSACLHLKCPYPTSVEQWTSALLHFLFTLPNLNKLADVARVHVHGQHGCELTWA